MPDRNAPKRPFAGAVVPSDGLPPRTLLVVDDEEGPRQSLRIIFEDRYRVFTVEDGRQAIEFARRTPVDAVILDIRLADMSGMEVLNRLKQIDSDIEVIILTAYNNFETAQEAIRLGASDYLCKPFEVHAMRAAVAKAVERKTQSEERRYDKQHILRLKDEIQRFQMRADFSGSEEQVYASILHDIHSPLSVISGSVDILLHQLASRSELRAGDVEDIRNRLSFITRQIEHCGHISRRYLRFLLQRSLESDLSSLCSVLQNLRQLFQLHPAARTHAIHIELPRRDRQVLINPTDLTQILLNLGLNALQATEKPHRVRIFTRQVSGPVRGSAMVDGPHDRWINLDGFANALPMLSLTVEDNGPGILPGAMPQIFNTIFSSKPNHQGTGLGLSIISWLVKAARGAIHCHSAPGCGARFTLYLPSQPRAPRRSSRAAPASSPAASPDKSR